VIKRLWHEIFHMVPGINPRPISALQLRCRAWYGSLGLIPGPIWKMSCNNLLLLYRHRWNTVISELNKNDNFTSEITIFISLSLYFAPFRCRRHRKTSSLKRVKIRRYLASCTLQFGTNLTKIIFQGKHFNYCIVVGEWRHVFWSGTHYSISLRYTRNIVQLNSFCIKFDSKHFFYLYNKCGHRNVLS
jgi:hypothetical protein